MACLEIRGLRKAYGDNRALDGVDLRLEEGRILGLIGPNGAGKSTALKAMLGLTRCDGEIRVLGLDPWTQRGQLMEDVAFVADVAVLPLWMSVGQVLAYAAGVHPRFDRARAEVFLARTTIQAGSRIRALSKGMVVQLHLALAMAIDARLLVLDEPTLGLDILYRKAFYETLLTDYFDHDRTIVVSTHEVDEIQHVLTDVAFLDRGRVVLNVSLDNFEARFTEALVDPARLDEARVLGPIHERAAFGRTTLVYADVDRARLAGLGEVRTPSLSDVFAAVIGTGRLA